MKTGVHYVNVNSKDKTREANMLLVYEKIEDRSVPGRADRPSCINGI